MHRYASSSYLSPRSNQVRFNMRDAASEGDKHFLAPKSNLKRPSSQSNHDQHSQGESKRRTYLHDTVNKPEQQSRFYTLQTGGSNEANMFQNCESIVSQDRSVSVSHPLRYKTQTALSGHSPRNDLAYLRKPYRGALRDRSQNSNNQLLQDQQTFDNDGAPIDYSRSNMASKERFAG